MQIVKRERVIAYIDGYNLYFGLKDSGFKRYLWLNIQEMVQNLLKPNQELVLVKYFTTLVTNNANTRLKQKCYLGAVRTLDLVEVFYGKFQREKVDCNTCGNSFQSECEKMTDVNIATQIMKDFYEDQYDMAMIISGDTDLLPPIRFVNDSKNKRAFVAFPPDRTNDEVRNAAKGSLVIGRKTLADSQFLDEVKDAENQVFKKPVTWV